MSLINLVKVLCLMALSVISIAAYADDFELADQYLGEGKLRKANWIYYSYLDKNERVSESYMGLARSHMRAKAYPEAIDSITRYLELLPEDRNARVLRAQLYIFTNQWNNAEAELLSVLPANDMPGVYLMLTTVYENLKQQEVAMRYRSIFDKLVATE